MSININAFYDELEKIAAQRCRTGSVPIRAAKLAAKSRYDKRNKKLIKLSNAQAGATAAKSLGNALWKYKKELGLVGAGAAGHQAVQDAMLGRRLRTQRQ